ncbi:hypothetical protein [Microvirga guangxiensis]|uniref:hypothetical protein n=1 Tax=Microvirga guangxiensis TaxID=549386 RepID=UPI000B850A31|nr:hypothetical protein [Microvirga guangxiensis]
MASLTVWADGWVRALWANIKAAVFLPVATQGALDAATGLIFNVILFIGRKHGPKRIFEKW